MSDLSPEDIIRRALARPSSDQGADGVYEWDGTDEELLAAPAALDVLLAERQQDKERVRQLVEALERISTLPNVRDSIVAAPGIARAAIAAVSQDRETPAAAVHEPAPRGWHQFMCRDNPTHIAEIKDTGEATESPFCRRCSKPMVLGGYREAARVPAPPPAKIIHPATKPLWAWLRAGQGLSAEKRAEYADMFMAIDTELLSWEFSRPPQETA